METVQYLNILQSLMEQKIRLEDIKDELIERM